MQLLKKYLASADVRMSVDELLTIHQSLNEVCNGIDLFEFQTPVGVSREEVSQLMNIISEIISKIDETSAENSR
jgi:hypothetical protein